MNTLVFYDSLYGNTENIARAIGSILEAKGPTEVLPIGDVSQLRPEIDLIVIGGPTQGHGMDPSMKAFIEGLGQDNLSGTAVAAFDTRLHWPKFLSGSAAQGIAERLSRKGAKLVTLPESFFVEGRTGPLAPGELERAKSWASDLADMAVRSNGIQGT